MKWVTPEVMLLTEYNTAQWTYHLHWLWWSSLYLSDNSPVLCLFPSGLSFNRSGVFFAFITYVESLQQIITSWYLDSDRGKNTSVPLCASPVCQCTSFVPPEQKAQNTKAIQGNWNALLKIQIKHVIIF